MECAVDVGRAGGCAAVGRRWPTLHARDARFGRLQVDGHRRRSVASATLSPSSGLATVQVTEPHRTRRSTTASERISRPLQDAAWCAVSKRTSSGRTGTTSPRPGRTPADPAEPASRGGTAEPRATPSTLPTPPTPRPRPRRGDVRPADASCSVRGPAQGRPARLFPSTGPVRRPHRNHPTNAGEQAAQQQLPAPPTFGHPIEQVPETKDPARSRRSDGISSTAPELTQEQSC